MTIIIIVLNVCIWRLGEKLLFESFRDHIVHFIDEYSSMYGIIYYLEMISFDPQSTHSVFLIR